MFQFYLGPSNILWKFCIFQLRSKSLSEIALPGQQQPIDISSNASQSVQQIIDAYSEHESVESVQSLLLHLALPLSTYSAREELQHALNSCQCPIEAMLHLGILLTELYSVATMLFAASTISIWISFIFRNQNVNPSWQCSHSILLFIPIFASWHSFCTVFSQYYLLFRSRLAVCDDRFITECCSYVGLHIIHPCRRRAMCGRSRHNGIASSTCCPHSKCPVDNYIFIFAATGII